ncbi:MAG: hypothetical protein WC832_13605, partial [Anaerolineales bacterium]
MVEHYARIAQVDVEQAHRKASPADNWRLSEAQEGAKTPGSVKSRADGPDGNGLFDCVRYADRHGDLRQP